MHYRRELEDGDQFSSELRTSEDEFVPIQPAEFPMKVPRRVIEFRTLLILRRVLDTARGLRAPSRSPHTPPRASPGEMA